MKNDKRDDDTYDNEQFTRSQAINFVKFLAVIVPFKIIELSTFFIFFCRLYARVKMRQHFNSELKLIKCKTFPETLTEQNLINNKFNNLI